MFLVHRVRFGYWAESDYMREGLLDPDSDEQVQNAAESGDVNELGRLRELGRRWTAQTCAGAAENGHLECLRFLHENECPWDERTCAYAARYGYPECLQYAHANGCPWDTMTCAGAALNGDLECLQYAHANGCPWDEETCTHAAFSGSLQCLQYAHEHGCPWDARVFEFANQRNNVEILQFARDHGLEGEVGIQRGERIPLPEQPVEGHRFGWNRQRVMELHRGMREEAFPLQDAPIGELQEADRDFIQEQARTVLAAVDEFREAISDQAYITIAEALQRIHDTCR